MLFHKSSCYVLVSVFCCFGFPGFACVLCVVFFLVCFWFLFFGGFKGEVRWPKGPPQLTLNPLCLFCFVLFLFCFCLFCFSCWVLCVLLFLVLLSLEGFQGQLRWPFGPPHLTLKSCLVVLVVCFRLCWNEQKTLFPPWKVFFPSFVFCLSSLFPLFFSLSYSLTFFLPYFVSNFLLFVSFLLSFFPSLFLPFSVSCFLS